MSIEEGINEGFRFYADFTGGDGRREQPHDGPDSGPIPDTLIFTKENTMAVNASKGENHFPLPTPANDTVPSYEEQRAEQEARGVAMRFNAGKLRFDLIPPDVLEVLAAIYTMGAAKYADRNWERGFDWMSCAASLERHYNDWKKGIDRDPESGELHMGHVAWNAFALIAFQLRGVGKDDRVKLS